MRSRAIEGRRAAPRRRAAACGRVLLTVAALVAVSAAGCRGAREQEGRGPGVEPGPGAIDHAEVAPGTRRDGGYFAGQAAAVEPEAQGAANVEVRLGDHSIVMPGSLPAGVVTFVVTNEGDAAHGYRVAGNGVEAQLDAPLAPGDTAELAVDLVPGPYTADCPDEGHREDGMVARFEAIR